MKRFVILTAIMVSFFYVSAQNSRQAMIILDNIFNTYINSRGTQITFTASATEANGNAMQRQKGIAKFKGDKFYIDMPTMKVWFDGKTQWTLMTDTKEVNISNPSKEEIASISPMALLGMYKTEYVVKQNIKKNINGQNSNFIKMSPINKDSEFKEVSIAVSSGGERIIQVNVFLKNGMKNIIDIETFNPKFKYNDKDFVFDKKKYKNFEIVDLR